MTERIQDPEFNKITENFHDPVITRILRDLSLGEDVVNSQQREPTLQEKRDFVASCNRDLERAGLLGAEVLYSGKLRTLYEPEFADEKKALSNKYGTCFEDDNKEEYYIVHKLPFVCRGVDIDQPDEYAGPNARQRAFIHLDLPGTEECEDDEDCRFVFLKDIDIFEFKVPSIDKLTRDIGTDFPEIAAQIARLPENCGRDKKIFDALRNFRLTIDWTKCHAKTDEERKQLLENISTYITEYLKFDSDLYRLRIKDSYVIFDTSGKEVSKSLPGPIPITGHTLQVVMTKLGNGGSSDIETYVPMVQLFASVKGRGNGITTVSIPAANILNIANLRNTQLFDPSVVEEQDAVLPASEDDYELIEAATASNKTIEASMPIAIPGEHAQSLVDSYKELINLNTCMNQLLEAGEKVCGTVYDSAEDAMEAYNALVALGQVFLDMYVNNPQPIEVSGPGLRSLAGETESSYNEKTSRIEINLPALTSMKNGDVFTTKTGQIITIAANVNPHANEPNKFVVKAELVLGDTGFSDPIVTPDPQTGLPMVIARTQSNFMAALNAETNMTLPVYERLKKCADLIAAVATDSPELKFLPWNLTELQAIIETSVSKGYVELSDTSLLRQIAEDSHANTTVTRRVVNVLSEILVHRPLKLAGAMYDPESDAIDDYTVIGSVVDVVDSAPNIDAQGPLLVIRELMGNYDDRWYVPIATIKKFEY